MLKSIFSLLTILSWFTTMFMGLVGQKEKIINTLKGLETPTDTKLLIVLGITIVITVIAVVLEEKS